MSLVLFWLTVAGYSAASALFLIHIFRRSDALINLARWTFTGVLAIHLAHIGMQCLQGHNPLQDTRGALSLSAWLIGVGYVITAWRSRLTVIGVFLAPVCLVLFFSSRLTPALFSAAGADRATDLLGKIHIALSVVGVALFGVAAAVSLLYIIQEGSLKKKRLALPRVSAPSLASLDEVGRRLILLGLPVFTLALICGVIWVTYLPAKEGLQPEYLLSALTWLIFAGLVLARIMRGLRGRRAALLTLFGFLTNILVLLLYMGRRMLGG